MSRARYVIAPFSSKDAARRCSERIRGTTFTNAFPFASGTSPGVFAEQGTAAAAELREDKNVTEYEVTLKSTTAE